MAKNINRGRKPKKDKFPSEASINKTNKIFNYVTNHKKLTCFILLTLIFGVLIYFSIIQYYERNYYPIKVSPNINSTSYLSELNCQSRDRNKAPVYGDRMYCCFDFINYKNIGYPSGIFYSKVYTDEKSPLPINLINITYRDIRNIHRENDYKYKVGEYCSDPIFISEIGKNTFYPAVLFSSIYKDPSTLGFNFMEVYVYTEQELEKRNIEKRTILISVVTLILVGLSTFIKNIAEFLKVDK